MNSESLARRVISPALERLVAGLLITGFAGLALGFSIGPIFEGPDEYDHYQYIRVVADEFRLPNPLIEEGRQFHQAPLYYALVAAPAALFDDPAYTDYADAFNPFRGYLFNIPSNDNKNVYIHRRSEQFPYSGNATALAVHALRLFSVALGALTLAAAYQCFRLLWPGDPARRLAALGVLAFWPQLASMFGVISNDTLLFLLTTISLWLLLRQSKSGPSWKSSALLGAALGAAMLTKISAVFLIFPVALVYALDRRSWRFAALALTVALAFCGWWYARNFVLFGDPTGARALFELTQPGEAIASGDFHPEVGLARLPFAYQTFWARFGDGRVPVGDGIYLFFSIVTVAALAGLIIRLIRSVARWRELNSRDLRRTLIVGVFLLAWVGLLVYYSSRAANGHQGRYLLPGLAGWAALIVAGLDGLSLRRFSVALTSGVVGAMVVVAAICLFGYYLPAYRPTTAPLAVAHPLSIRYGDAAELVGIDPPLVRARPDDTVRITLVWRALRPTDSSLQVYLHTQGSDLVRRDSLPATGNLLSTDWIAGEMWAEQYLVSIPADAEEQVAYSLVAGLYDPQTGEALPALDATEQVINPVVGRIAISGPTDAERQPVYRFGEIIGLEESDITREGDQLRVCLRWVSIAEAPTDYQIFIHVLGPDGQIITQADRQPKEGVYPTSVWSPGEVIADCAALDAANIPVDGWQVALGLYDLVSGQRLPISRVEDGTSLGDALILSP